MTAVGGSLRRSLRAPLEHFAAQWPVCELVPETWNPENGADAEYLEQLSGRTQLYLHSLSLNPLGDEPNRRACQRIAAWRRRLKINTVSDHFSWTGAGGLHPGVFLPPIEDIGAMRARVANLRDRLGCELVLENIAIAAHSAEMARRYHRALVEVCSAEAVPVLLDIENLRLDSAAAGIEMEELLALYEHVAVHSYHIAGSDAAEPFADTHRSPSSAESIDTLRGLLRRRPAPVFYERDYALDALLIAAEVERLCGELSHEHQEAN